MSVEVVERDVIEGARDAEPRAGRSALNGVLQDARLLLVGMWLGASLFFSFVLAPSVFRVLRDSTALYANHLAGTIVTRNLSVINTSGLVLSLLLLASAFLYRRSAGHKAFLAEIISLVVVATATSLGQWMIAARMLALRARMGRPIDETAANDPLRLAFDNLHVYSVGALVAAMLAAFVAFVLIARRARRHGS